MDNLATAGRQNKPRWWDLLFGALVILLAYALSRYFFQLANHEARSQFQEQAASVARAINMEHMRNLSGTIDDLQLPDYHRLKQQLTLTRQLYPDSRFIYIMGMNDAGAVFFFVDSEPPDSPDTSNPGDIYPNPSSELIDFIVKSRPGVEGPVVDQWGTWISANAPIIDPNNATQGSATVGMDIDANTWDRLVNRTAWSPILLTCTMGFLTLLAYIWLRFGMRSTARRFIRPEALILLLLGANLTLLASWFANHNNRLDRRVTFSRMADISSSALATYLQDLENIRLENLARFFTASQQVTREEYTSFTEALIRDDRVQTWEWAPRVAASQRDQFEREVSADLGTPFTIWEINPAGDRVPAAPRDFHYPVLFAAPLEGNEAVIGYDLASEPSSALAISDALTSGLTTASDPIALVQDPAGPAAFLVMRPIAGNGSAELPVGLVLAVIRIQDIVCTPFRNIDCADSIYADLYQLQDRKPPLFISSNAPPKMIDSHLEIGLNVHPDTEETRLAPIHAFGKVYAIVAHPNPLLSRSLPGPDGVWVILIGASLTLLLAAMVNILTTRRDTLEIEVAQRTSELSASESKYRSLAESVKAVIWEYDIEQDRYVYMAPQVVELFGWSPDSWTNQQFWFDHLHPDDRQPAAEYFSSSVARGVSFPIEYRFLRRDGTYVWISDFISIEDCQGKPAVLRGVALDITEQKRAEQALRDSETLYRELFEAESDALLLTTRGDGNILHANQAATEVTGYTNDELRKLTLNNLSVEPGTTRAILEASDALSRIQVPLRWFRRKDGTRFPVEITGRPFVWNDQRVVLVAVRDISDRLRAEADLRMQSAALESAANAIIITNRDGTIKWVNPAFTALTGYELTEALGWKPRDLLQSGVQDDAFYRRLWDTILAGRVWRGEVTNRRKDGSLYMEELTITPVRGSSGEIEYFIDVKQDISERKRAETALQHRHDFENLVTDISSRFIRLVSSELDEALQQTLKQIGAFAGVDRSYIFLFSPDGREASNTHEWCAGGIEPQIANLQNIPTDMLPWWMKKMTRFEDIYLPALDLLPEEAVAEQEFLQSQGIRSLLVVPMRQETSLVGFMGFDTVRFEKDWSDEEIKLLHMIADILTNALVHQRNEAEQKAMLSVTASLRDVTKPEHIYKAVLKQVATLVNATGGAIMTYDYPREEQVLLAAIGEFKRRLIPRIPISESLSRQMIQDKAPLVFADVLTESSTNYPRAFKRTPAVIILPLMAGDEVFGSLWLGRATPFQSHEARLLNVLSEFIASFTHRATLYQAAQQQVEQLTVLRAIDQRISSSTFMRSNLDFILQAVRTHLAVDAASIFRLVPNTKVLRYVAGQGFKDDSIQYLQLLPGDSIASVVVENRAPLFIPDLSNSPFTGNPAVVDYGFKSYYGLPLIVKDEVIGVLEAFTHETLEPDSNWRNFFEILAGQTAIAINSSDMYADLQQALSKLVRSYDATIEGWSRAMDLRDKETEGHTQRVTEMTLTLARAAGISPDDLVHIRRGALLHDIGKLGIPDHILLKPDKLTDEEWVAMHRHPVHAYEMLRSVDYLEPALDIPYCHHERWDGSGYPRGLKGEEIPLAARIFAVVDVFDALTSDRPYRPAWSREKALDYIREGSGSHFDPMVANLFLKMMGET